MLQEEKLRTITDYLINNYHNGSIIKLEWKSVYYDAKNHVVIKHVEAYERLGVAYNNINGVENKHLGLKGDQDWSNKYFIKNNSTGEIKLRVANLRNMKNLKTKSYYIDEGGNIYNKPEEINYLPESKKHSLYNNEIVVFDIKLNNLLALGELKF